MPRHPPRRALALIDVIVVMAVLATLMGLSLKALQKVRESSARLACQSNMRQLGQAIHHYHDQKKYFPSSQDGAGKNVTTWLKAILPYVGYQDSKAEDPVPIYVCPADRDAQSLVFKGVAAAASPKTANKVCNAEVAAGSPTLLASTSASSTAVKYACSSYVRRRDVSEITDAGG
jgi:type II secretory pathway pseudopilin PulG